MLGGGVAGRAVARYLGRDSATVVNPGHRSLCPHAELVLGTAVRLDASRRVVTVESASGTHALAYAQLVVAVGAGRCVAGLGLPIDGWGRVTVDETWAVLGASHVWALGRCAAPSDAGYPNPVSRRDVRRHARSLAAILRGSPPLKQRKLS